MTEKTCMGCTIHRGSAQKAVLVRSGFSDQCQQIGKRSVPSTSDGGAALPGLNGLRSPWLVHKCRGDTGLRAKTDLDVEGGDVYGRGVMPTVTVPAALVVSCGAVFCINRRRLPIRWRWLAVRRRHVAARAVTEQDMRAPPPRPVPIPSNCHAPVLHRPVRTEGIRGAAGTGNGHLLCGFACASAPIRLDPKVLFGASKNSALLGGGGGGGGGCWPAPARSHPRPARPPPPLPPAGAGERVREVGGDGWGSPPTLAALPPRPPKCG